MTGKTKKGFSLIEMLIVVGILAILASASVPVAELSYNSSKEEELQTSLESMREAIALWRRDCRNAVVAQAGYDKLEDVPYCNLCPPNLEALVSCSRDIRYPDDTHFYVLGNKDEYPIPVDVIEDKYGNSIATFIPRKYLDKIPEDPFVGRACWFVHVANQIGTADTQICAAYGLRENETKVYSKAALASGTLYTVEAGIGYKGVFDVSCIPSYAVDPDDYYTRRGYNISVDGTKYEDW